MPIGKSLDLFQDLETPGQWDDLDFAFEFSTKLKVGDMLASIVGIATETPSDPPGCSPLTVGARLAQSIVGTQVIVSVTLPAGAVAGGIYGLTCTCLTTAGERITRSGQLVTRDSQ